MALRGLARRGVAWRSRQGTDWPDRARSGMAVMAGHDWTRLGLAVGEWRVELIRGMERHGGHCQVINKNAY